MHRLRNLRGLLTARQHCALGYGEFGQQHNKLVSVLAWELGRDDMPPG